MRAGSAAVHGLGQALAAPGIVLLVWLAGVLFALPAVWSVGEAIHEASAATLASDRLRAGFDSEWFDEFHESAGGVTGAFDPGLTGAGGPLRNLEGWFTGGLFRQPPLLLGLALLHGIVWLWLLGGALERFSGTGSGRREGLLRAGAGYLPRFVRLAVVGAVLYFLIFRATGVLYGRVEEWTRDAGSEGEVLAWTLGVVAVGALLLLAARTGLAYAKVAIVIEDRRSALLAALRGLGFVLSHPGRTLGLAGGYGLLSLMVLAAFAWLAPGSRQASGLTVTLAFLAAQAFLLGRVLLRLSLAAGEAALYRSLTRTGY